MKQSELLKAISLLTPYQKNKLERYILDALHLNQEDQNVKPEICPYCHEKSHMIKKGFKCGKQRFQCKSCKHVFTYNSHTITMYAKIDRSMFLKIVQDTLDFVPIKKTAADLDLSIPCVFENRHKLLCALEELLTLENQLLSGTIEFDETFVLVSNKGSRNINKKARKRGEPSEYRGLSHEQICIVTTTDRNGHEIFKMIGFGKPTSDSILQNFSKNLVKKSILYTDGSFCYDKLAQNTECGLVQLKDHHSYNKVEHINTVNYIHSFIKRKLAHYRGVATKYMNRYLSLFVFTRRFQEMDDNEKMPIISRNLKTLHYTITRGSLKNTHLIAV